MDSRTNRNDQPVKNAVEDRHGRPLEKEMDALENLKKSQTPVLTDSTWTTSSPVTRPASTSTVSDASLKTSEQLPETSKSSSTTHKSGRKPYKLKKARENWTTEEHERFVQALRTYGRDWKKIRDCVGGKDLFQIRSHAQKYFIKVQKHGMQEYVPPPRPKKKTSKANTAVICSESVNSFNNSSGLESTDNFVFSQYGNSRNDHQVVNSFFYHNGYIHKESNPSDLEKLSKELSIESTLMHVPESIEANELNDMTSGPDFSKIYQVFSRICEEAAKDEMEVKVKDAIQNLSIYDKELVCLLARNMKANLSNELFRTAFMEVGQMLKNEAIKTGDDSFERKGNESNGSS